MEYISRHFADKITIKWNPATDDGTVDFMFNKYLDLDGEGTIIGYREHGGAFVITETISSIATRINVGDFQDPITGNTLPEISGAALMVLIKQIVDQIRGELGVNESNTEPEEE